MTKYPQGGEKQLINAVTGRQVPSGGLPADAGCIVHNIDTVVAIYYALKESLPLMRRIVTVAGGAIRGTRRASSPNWNQYSGVDPGGRRICHRAL